MQFFQDLMPSLRLSKWAPTAIRKHLFNEETETLDSLCAMMMASDGEYSSLLLAERILNAYEGLDAEGRLEFFTLLHTDYDIDPAAIKRAVRDYERSPDAANLLRVTDAADCYAVST
jgi:malonyl-CoA decarboxylase